MQYAVWHRVRRPFRYPSCRACTWEVFDSGEAGCLKCGRHHVCHSNAVDCVCPLIECDDRTRVCSITGLVLREVRHSREEFSDCVVCPDSGSCKNMGTATVVYEEVLHAAQGLLCSRAARECRENENAKQTQRLCNHMLRQMKHFKLVCPGQQPNVCVILGLAISQEKYWRFIEQASDELVRKAAQAVHECMVAMLRRGLKITPGTRTRDLVCGLLYMLKHGLFYHERMILSHIPEVERCLPHENKVEAYFGVSSKVICMTENEVKLIFRESFQG